MFKRINENRHEKYKMKINKLPTEEEIMAEKRDQFNSIYEAVKDNRLKLTYEVASLLAEKMTDEEEAEKLVELIIESKDMNKIRARFERKFRLETDPVKIQFVSLLCQRCYGKNLDTKYKEANKNIRYEWMDILAESESEDIEEVAFKAAFKYGMKEAEKDNEKVLKDYYRQKDKWYKK
ncbi:MAG: hypothetical protein N3G74_00400 [Candidatus Micrarchaeota archaeon]|nr:hypothetical protein [Candidatus Micrarchaeota archaeon]